MCVRLSIHMQTCNKFKMNWPSAGLSSQNPCACSLRVQVPGVPDSRINLPHCEEKSWQGRRPHSRISWIRVDSTFSIAVALEALGPAGDEQKI